MGGNTTLLKFLEGDVVWHVFGKPNIKDTIRTSGKIKRPCHKESAPQQVVTKFSMI